MDKQILVSVLAIFALAGLGIWYFAKTPTPLTYPVPPKSTSTTPTSADNAPPGSIHNLPTPEPVRIVKKLIAQDLGIAEGEVIILEAHERMWKNSCLGLESKDTFCSQVIVPGYIIVAQAKGKTFTYRTNTTGSVVRAE